MNNTDYTLFILSILAIGFGITMSTDIYLGVSAAITVALLTTLKV